MQTQCGAALASRRREVIERLVEVIALPSSSLPWVSDLIQIAAGDWCKIAPETPDQGGKCDS